MKKYLTLKEVQKSEVNILNNLLKLLKQESINYYIYAGSMIGAIRHKGFIPWDDDIDIIIPRPDYEKLIEYLKKNNNILYKNFQGTSYELGNSKFPFLKIIDKNIKLETNNDNDEFLWIDIFPIDGIPNNYNFFISKNRFLKKLYYLKRYELNKNNFNFSFKKKLSKELLLLLFKPISYDKITEKIIKNSKKYDFDKSDIVGILAWGDCHSGDILNKKWLENYELQFEHIKVNGFKNYDIYLKNRYGNYMELPPKNERISHNFKAWRIKDEGNN